MCFNYELSAIRSNRERRPFRAFLAVPYARRGVNTDQQVNLTRHKFRERSRACESDDVAATVVEVSLGSSRENASNSSLAPF